LRPGSKKPSGDERFVISEIVRAPVGWYTHFSPRDVGEELEDAKESLAPTVITQQIDRSMPTDLSRLSDAELETLEALIDKAAGGDENT
jgi:hypothetical protein